MFGLKKAFLKKPYTMVNEKNIDEYMIINANLASILEKQSKNAFAICGISKNDNKSEVAINCAITFLKIGKKVLFINCDEDFQLPNELQGIDTYDGRVASQAINYAKSKMNDYDIIIVNVKNINQKVESVQIAKEIGGLVFVINKLLAKKKEFSEILSSYAHVDVNILGAIFVDVK